MKKIMFLLVFIIVVLSITSAPSYAEVSTEDYMTVKKLAMKYCHDYNSAFLLKKYPSFSYIEINDDTVFELMKVKYLSSYSKYDGSYYDYIKEPKEPFGFKCSLNNNGSFYVFVYNQCEYHIHNAPEDTISSYFLEVTLTIRKDIDRYKIIAVNTYTGDSYDELYDIVSQYQQNFDEDYCTSVVESIEAEILKIPEKEAAYQELCKQILKRIQPFFVPMTISIVKNRYLQFQ